MAIKPLNPVDTSSHLGAPLADPTGTVSIRMKTRVVYTDGTPLTTGNTYTVTAAWGKQVVENNQATLISGTILQEGAPLPAVWTDENRTALVGAGGTPVAVPGAWNGLFNPADGTLYIGPDLATQSPITQSIVKSATLPSATYPNVSVFELQHDGGGGYLFHLTQGANMGSTDALIGMGIDEAGRGLYINNKKTGVGIVITQNSTITSATAYGMLVNGGKGSAPAVFMQQNNDNGSGNAQTLLVLHAYQTFSAASQKLMEWRKPNGGADGDLAGYIRADDGALVQQGPLIVSGGNLSVAAVTGIGGTVTAEVLSVSASGANISLYNSAGTSNKRMFRWTVSSDILVLSGRNDAGTSTGDVLYAQNTTKNIGLCGYSGWGGGSAVVAVPNASVVPTTNPSGGGVIYCEAGALKYRGSSGTITTLGAA